MITTVLEWLSVGIINIIERTGYAGITVLSALESANIPVPSEIVVPFAGFLASGGTFLFLGVVLAATLGNVIGSWISYEIGAYGGRTFLVKYGKWFFVTSHDLDTADRLFSRFGFWIIFISRLLPVVRTFISFPAGVARMPRYKFFFYTLTGSLIWNTGLAYIGFFLGENWDSLGKYFHTSSWLIVLVIGITAIWWIFRHVRAIKNEL